MGSPRTRPPMTGSESESRWGSASGPQSVSRLGLKRHQCSSRQVAIQVFPFGYPAPASCYHFSTCKGVDIHENHPTDVC
jgi:hypothetical protein